MLAVSSIVSRVVPAMGETMARSRTQKLVEQTRFARVGPAHDRRAKAATKYLPLARRAKQIVHELDAML